MNFSLPYLIEVSVCLIVIYTLYFAALRQFTFFHANRFYLLSGSVLSFLIPLLSIPVFKHDYAFISKSSEMLPVSYALLPMYEASVQGENAISFSFMLSIGYIVGVSVLFVRFLTSLFHILKLIRNGASEKFNDHCTIIRLPNIQPFSFGKWIFLPHGKVDPLIIEHERIHICQWHWVDLLIIEIVKCLQWFNPVIYFYKRSIQLQHEYLADSGTVEAHGQVENYMRAVMTQLRTNSTSIPVSRFHSLSIKKRILMMTQNQTSRSRALWYALSLPIVASLLFSFAFTSDKKATIRSRVSVPEPRAVTFADHVPSIHPVDISQVKTVVEYGERMHPLLHHVKMHTGLDFMVAEGTDIVATADGFVVEAAYDGAHGNYVIVKHGDTYTTRYSHMKSFTVKAGQNVRAGEKIGHVGSTGLSTGPHLHYEVFEKNKQVDPKKFMPKIGC